VQARLRQDAGQPGGINRCRLTGQLWQQPLERRDELWSDVPRLLYSDIHPLASTQSGRQDTVSDPA
jgi:hypothetical protein